MINSNISVLRFSSPSQLSQPIYESANEQTRAGVFSSLLFLFSLLLPGQPPPLVDEPDNLQVTVVLAVITTNNNYMDIEQDRQHGQHQKKQNQQHQPH